MNATTKLIIGAQCDKWDEIVASQHEPFLYIAANGSKWMGDEPDSIDDLLNTLRKHTLDPRFEQYGNFITENPCEGVRDEQGNWIDGPRLFRTDVTHFFGNFFDVSHVFQLYTNDQAIIAALTSAIRANQQTEAYAQAGRETRS